MDQGVDALERGDDLAEVGRVYALEARVGGARHGIHIRDIVAVGQ